MLFMRLFLALCGCLLLSGCTPKLFIELFNETGQSISVLEGSQRTVIPSGQHKRISYFGAEQADSDLYGPTIQAGKNRWFYPVSTSQRGLLNPPGHYDRNIGLGRGLYFALDAGGNLYLLSSKSQDLPSAIISQPSGFPLKPQ